MCRNIKTLFNFDPVATDEEIRAAALQFTRKISGFKNPSKTNQEAFDRAVYKFSEVTHELLHSLTSTTKPKNREDEIEKLKAQSVKRFGPARD